MIEGFSSNVFLDVQEPFSFGLTGNGACRELAKPLVAIRRNQVVNGVAQQSRENLPGQGKRAPDSAEFRENERHRIRAVQQAFRRPVWIYDNVKSIQFVGAPPIPFKNLAREGALQCSESKKSVTIVPEHKLHQAVAQPANTVIQQNRIGTVFQDALSQSYCMELHDIDVSCLRRPAELASVSGTTRLSFRRLSKKWRFSSLFSDTHALVISITGLCDPCTGRRRVQPSSCR